MTNNISESEIAQQLQLNVKIIENLKSDINLLKTASLENIPCIQPGYLNDQEKFSSSASNELLEENKRLKLEIDDLLSKLLSIQMMNGELQYVPPCKFGKQLPCVIGDSKNDIANPVIQTASKLPIAPVEKANTEAKSQLISSGCQDPVATVPTNTQKIPQKSNKPKGAGQIQSDSDDKTKASGTSSTIVGGSELVHVGRLDMRVGQILEVEKHPNADGLYVEKVDVGEAQPRTIISGLVKHVPLEQMQNRLGIFLCNLKAAKMRGIDSQGMLMCASCPDTGVVQILDPPAGVKPGDRVIVPGFDELKPDEVLNPKKKIWETVKPELRVNSDRVATFRDVPWEISGGKGKVLSPSLVNVPIQ